MESIVSTDMMKNQTPASAAFITPEGLFFEQYADTPDMMTDMPAATITGTYIVSMIESRARTVSANNDVKRISDNNVLIFVKK
ncbi:MAG: hypothetical protein IKH06_06825, partial [Clostridiales bacterium]|nr:hypothetical protein [Clostridiales bacterium]